MDRIGVLSFSLGVFSRKERSVRGLHQWLSKKRERRLKSMLKK